MRRFHYIISIFDCIVSFYLLLRLESTRRLAIGSSWHGCEIPRVWRLMFNVIIYVIFGSDMGLDHGLLQKGRRFE